MIFKFGSSRLCILTKNYAFKIPRLSPYRSFLRGLLANLQEQSFCRSVVGAVDGNDSEGGCKIYFESVRRISEPFTQGELSNCQISGI